MALSSFQRQVPQVTREGGTVAQQRSAMLKDSQSPFDLLVYKCVVVYYPYWIRKRAGSASHTHSGGTVKLSTRSEALSRWGISDVELPYGFKLKDTGAALLPSAVDLFAWNLLDHPSCRTSTGIIPDCLWALALPKGGPSILCGLL